MVFEVCRDQFNRITDVRGFWDGPVINGPAILHIPTEWEMFTKRGNESIAAKAAAFVAKLANSKSPAVAARTFLRSYRRLRFSKTMPEASDTAVRQSVWCFIEQFGPIIGSDKLERLWQEEIG